MAFFEFADKNYLRILNAFIVHYGINETIKTNIKNGKSDYLENLVSSFKTGILGVLFGIISLIVFIYIKSGESYLQKLSDTFFFGEDNNIIKYCSILFFEGIASSLIGLFTLMQYWKDVQLKDKA